MMIITIDGPAGSGKSTVAKELSRKLGIPYIETGSMYRAVAWWCKENDINPDDESRVVDSLKEMNIDFVTENNRFIVLHGGRIINEELFAPEIGDVASKVAKIPGVRDFLVARQRELCEKGSCILEGRDLGTVVFPDADYKFFLVTSVEERARRRVRQLEEKGIRADFKNVLEAIRRRDIQDETREVAPLKPAPDATVIDTTHLSIDDVVETIVSHIRV